jgi:hypothetical protein
MQGWRKLHDEEFILYSLSNNIAVVIKLRWMMQMGHAVCNMREMGNAKKMLF